ncbi:MAG: DNA mismatch repair protein MutS [Chloroflexota bacterium]|nr:DNA mismatch repair protein MutS [Dehalococcoidia bacterium]MDW8253725.1 DNA mismatch repair protein MutS [Chloroflexota bacterium]
MVGVDPGGGTAYINRSMTPAYRQYLAFKRQYPDCILFFQLGDFYETFDDDAKVVASVCDIVLTSRGFGPSERRPLAGVPVRSAEVYIAKLIAAGKKVVVVDQVERTGGPGTTLRNAQAAAARAGAGPAPKGHKALFERYVSRVVTPGTALDPVMLDAKANNYLVALLSEGGWTGIAAADVSTGEFFCLQVAEELAAAELERLSPAEIILPRQTPAPQTRAAITERDPWQFDFAVARETLFRHFDVATLEPFGCADRPLAARAAGALLAYLAEMGGSSLGQLTRLVTVNPERTMVLDAPTRRNLELAQGGRSGVGSLVSVLDLTRTAMGGRLLRRWLLAPLLDRAAVHARQEIVAALYENALRRADVIAALAPVADLERLAQRIASGHAGPREVVALRRSLDAVPALAAALAGDPRLAVLAARLDPCDAIRERIALALRDDPPAQLDEGGVIRPGYSAELDELVEASRDGKAYIATLERRERERTGIASLKVGFNKVFGYYLEVSHANASRVPPDYIRKQTLVGAERYITPEMKEVEARVLHAQEKIIALETQLYRELCRFISERIDEVRATAAAVAELDVFAALAEVAVRQGYCRPVLDESDRIEIRAGRHPVVETTIGEGRFVPNDVTLSCEDAQIIILTGPNMAGKSVFLRQVALIVLLAQIGSFVPAAEARIGMVDRIFTRVGAQDDPAAGQSTFMVEMAETANILHHATRRSLIILDEVGRGTSTYDGMAIARAIVEYLHDHPRLGAKTLFATHYHELTALERYLPRVRNYRMDVLEEGDRVVFLHRVVPGGADRSYGLYVAKIAGVPRAVIQRAEEILRELEQKAASVPSARRPKGNGQLPLLPVGGSLLEELAMLDVDSMTPLEAITRLYELRERAAMAFRLVR